MAEGILQQASEVLGMPVYLVVIIIIWSLAWKGAALWKSARRNSLAWFVALLLINTIGILEILYIFVFSEMKFDGKTKQSSKIKSPKKR